VQRYDFDLLRLTLIQKQLLRVAASLSSTRSSAQPALPRGMFCFCGDLAEMLEESAALGAAAIMGIGWHSRC
jgi:hypothetical protein